MINYNDVVKKNKVFKENPWLNTLYGLLRRIRHFGILEISKEEAYSLIELYYGSDFRFKEKLYKEELELGVFFVQLFYPVLSASLHTPICECMTRPLCAQQ